jgi:hypothetical protein
VYTFGKFSFPVWDSQEDRHANPPSRREERGWKMVGQERWRGNMWDGKDGGGTSRWEKCWGWGGITKEMMPGLGGGRRRKRVLGQGNKSGLEIRSRSRCETAHVEQ